MDETNHHLHKPVMIGEIQGNGQFNVVWKTKGPIRAQPWSPFIPGNEKKQNTVAEAIASQGEAGLADAARAAV